MSPEQEAEYRNTRSLERVLALVISVGSVINLVEGASFSGSTAGIGSIGACGLGAGSRTWGSGTGAVSTTDSDFTSGAGAGAELIWDGS